MVIGRGDRKIVMRKELAPFANCNSREVVVADTPTMLQSFVHFGLLRVPQHSGQVVVLLFGN